MARQFPGTVKGRNRDVANPLGLRELDMRWDFIDVIIGAELFPREEVVRNIQGLGEAGLAGDHPFRGQGEGWGVVRGIHRRAG